MTTSLGKLSAASLAAALALTLLAPPAAEARRAPIYHQLRAKAEKQAAFFRGARAAHVASPTSHTIREAGVNAGAVVGVGVTGGVSVTTRAGRDRYRLVVSPLRGFFDGNLGMPFLARRIRSTGERFPTLQSIRFTSYSEGVGEVQARDGDDVAGYTLGPAGGFAKRGRELRLNLSLPMPFTVPSAESRRANRAERALAAAQRQIEASDYDAAARTLREVEILAIGSKVAVANPARAARAAQLERLERVLKLQFEGENRRGEWSTRNATARAIGRVQYARGTLRSWPSNALGVIDEIERTHPAAFAAAAAAE